ncbi:MAG TPA: hydroxyacylglutathione hydrolase [Candidatus Binatia bacterium]|nr:hydroxyacylglutathione hydrolase [Candidatus Binatia bacterium]
MTLMISPLAAFADNYIWLLARGRDAVVVDPGDAAPVRQALTERGLRLAAILVTHHHADHVGGVAALAAEHAAPVYGPVAEARGIPKLTHPLADGDRVELPAIGVAFDVWSVPGHTLGHIAYVSADHGLLFCGDTLFSAGCGRLFEGTPAQMHASLSRLAALPGSTAVYCTHEYTLSNLAFAGAVEPGNAAVRADAERVRALRARGAPSLPSRIAHELAVNPFLRWDAAEVRAAAHAHAGHELREPVDVFAELRAWKDGFRAPAAP